MSFAGRDTSSSGPRKRKTRKRSTDFRSRGPFAPSFSPTPGHCLPFSLVPSLVPSLSFLLPVQVQGALLSSFPPRLPSSSSLLLFFSSKSTNHVSHGDEAYRKVVFSCYVDKNASRSCQNYVTTIFECCLIPTSERVEKSCPHQYIRRFLLPLLLPLFLLLHRHHHHHHYNNHHHHHRRGETTATDIGSGCILVAVAGDAILEKWAIPRRDAALQDLSSGSIFLISGSIENDLAKFVRMRTGRVGRLSLGKGEGSRRWNGPDGRGDSEFGRLRSPAKLLA